MSRTKKFFYNSLSMAILSVVVMIVGFITPKVMLVYYGSEINGLVSSITQFISYFNLVEAGLSGAAIYALYKPLANNDHKAINSVVVAAKNFYAQAGYIFVGLVTILAICYPFYIQTDSLSSLQVGILVLILGVNGALDFFTLSKYRSLLSADQKTYVISIATIAYQVLYTIIIVLMAKLGADIVLLRFVALLSIFLRSFILMIYCKKNYRYLDFKEKPNKEALNKRWDALYLQILGAIQTGAPVILLTVILKDLNLVSIYSVYNMVLVGISSVLGIFVSGLAASFGDVIAKGELLVLQKASKEFEFCYYSLITIVYSVAFILIVPFVEIYTQGVEDINYNVPIVGFLCVLNGLLYNIKTPQGMLVISAGLYKETKWQTTIQGVIAVIGGAILAPFWGIIGVLLGSILSNIYRDIDLLIFIPRSLTKLKVRSSFFRVIRIFICVFFIHLPFWFIDVKTSNYFNWAIWAIIITVYAFIVVLVIALIFDKKELLNVMRRIKTMVGVKRAKSVSR